MSQLVLIDEATGTEYALGPEVRIGRGRRCDIRLDDGDCRREHAAVAHFSSGYAITPLGKKAIVSVNGEQVSGSRQLEHGDRILVGSTTLVVGVGDPFGPPVDHDAHRGAVPPPPAHAPKDLRPKRAARDLPVEFAPQHPRRQRRRSAATRGWATLVCFLIVLADAIAVSWYLTGN